MAAHTDTWNGPHPVVTWRDLVQELRTGQYESSQIWDLVDAVCMGTLLLMAAGAIISVLAILVVQVV
ncbi:MAG: hypothetical protein KGN76_12020 [Acidobacteriota bacterium]|nr:hypothetical protein [Acidobacteriota bacterium]